MWNGLVQERRNSIANTLELRLSCTTDVIFADCFWNFSKDAVRGSHAEIGTRLI